MPQKRRKTPSYPSVSALLAQVAVPNSPLLKTSQAEWKRIGRRVDMKHPVRVLGGGAR